MNRFQLVAALAFLAFSATYLVLAGRLPIGSGEQPGAGLFPVLVGVFLLVASSAFLFQCLRRTPRALTPRPAKAGQRVTGVVVALAAFCLLLPWLGYGVASLGLLLVILRLFGLARWRVTGAVALLATAASYYLFAVLLGVPLPAWPWSR